LATLTGYEAPHYGFFSSLSPLFGQSGGEILPHTDESFDNLSAGRPSRIGFDVRCKIILKVTKFTIAWLYQANMLEL
jgi:hypothetical protein